MDRGESARALFLGLLADVFVTTVGGVAAVIGVAVVLTLAGAQQALQEQALLASLPLLIIEMVFGPTCTMLGAYVTATLAPTEKLRHALGMGFLSVLTSLVMMAFSPRQGSIWSYVASCLLLMPAALLGGYLGTVLGQPKKLFTRFLLAASGLTFLYAVALGCAAVLAVRS